MGILLGFLYVVEVIISLMLIAIILVQKSKGGGLGTGFGSAMGESLFGSHANKVLTKITIILSTIFCGEHHGDQQTWPSGYRFCGSHCGSGGSGGGSRRNRTGWNCAARCFRIRISGSACERWR